MVGDEGEVTRTQGVQTEKDQVIKWAKGICGHDHNLLEDVILFLAYHSYHRFRKPAVHWTQNINL